jgi:ATP-dependent Clp protease protease subunit
LGSRWAMSRSETDINPMPKAKSHVNTQVTSEAAGGTAMFRVTSRISEYSESINSEALRGQIDGFLNDGVRSARIYINSQGGSVFEARELANEFGRFDNVTVSVGSLAASAATYLVAKFHSTAKANSQLMIHRPSMGTYGDINTLEADLKLLRDCTEDYKNTYAKKTGKTPEEIEGLWAKGDYWMTAAEAKALGLIDGVEAGEEPVSADTVVLLEACGAPVVPRKSKQHQNQKKSHMEKEELIAALGLDADATDEQITAALKEAKEKAERLDGLEADAEKNAKDRAAKLVAQAIREKKIQADQADMYTRLATADYDTTAEILGAIEAPEKPRLGGNGKQADAARKDWKLEDWIEKDPGALAALEYEDPERFAAINEAYFKQSI